MQLLFDGTLDTEIIPTLGSYTFVASGPAPLNVFLQDTLVQVSREEKCRISPAPFKAVRGVFPTYGSLFAPSCYPNVLEVSYSDHIVVRARRPIKEGEVIDKVGLPFQMDGFSFRKIKYAELYGIESCPCRACVESWPEGKNLGFLGMPKGLCECVQESFLKGIDAMRRRQPAAWGSPCRGC